MSAPAVWGAQAGARWRASPALLLGAALLLAGVLAVQAGAVPVAGRDWGALLGPSASAPDASLDAPAGLSGGAYVLWHIRLPRAVFAMLVGASMGLAGALTQGLFRNPLADPGLLGVSAGAACAAALTIVLVSGPVLALPQAGRVWALPVAAFAGALGLLLTGVALNALAAAVIGLCTYLATDEQLRSLSFWTLGSLAGAQWGLVLLMGALLLVAVWPLRQIVRSLNALALGEAAAAHVGVDVQRLRGRVIVLVAVLAGFSVAWCGMIGFIGLIAPHLVRVWVGGDQRRVLPLSLLMGGLLLLVADTLARTVAIPAEIPVGIFTALLGSPFFLFLLRGARGRIS